MGKYLDKYPLLLKTYRYLNKSLKNKPYQSETSKVRNVVLPYCEGLGCDIGFGGDKIKKTNCLGIDLATPYAFTGQDKVDVTCDLFKEKIPFPDNTFDYVYSSHLIEDFEDTTKTLLEMSRVLKNNGNLIIVFPDQIKYEAFCKLKNQTPNAQHIHKVMGLQFMIKCLEKLNSNNLSTNIIFSEDCKIDYNVIIVCKILK